jgi:hypothetical protein
MMMMMVAMTTMIITNVEDKDNGNEEDADNECLQSYQ